MAASRRLRLNFLGIIALLLGAAACVATRVPLGGYGPMTIGLVGIGVGVLGFLLAVSTGRWGSGIPVLGVVVSLAAVGLSLYNDGRLPWIDHLRGGHSQVQPATAPPAPAPQPTPPPTANNDPHISNIFDDRGSPPTVPGSYKPRPAVDPQPEPSPIVKHATEPAVPAPAVQSTNAAAALQAARAKTEAASQALLQTLSNDPAYKAAKAQADAADANRQAALTANGPGSPEVLAASRQWLDAKTALLKITANAAANDPATQEAHRELMDAEAAMRAGKK
ncbi:MAG TPA: hypothetical protein VG269_19030 [Tepidisphaeraceae bacterium]|jgi:hypothetical protein|nr:hypothetical protein [Tepidisphaeraceae bacterium]